MTETTSTFTTMSTQGKNFRIQSHDDATWILTSAFVVFTMQSGFGLLESGSVSSKNEVNIMVKNAVDVIFGGLTYWMFGYGLSFGEDEHYSNLFNGWGDFFVTANEENLGWVYAKFFFQASFATTATTIVSGAMAERTRLEAYILFSLLNTFVYCFPAHWVWGKKGWLQVMGVVDIAGAGPVHMVGGISGLVATLLLKPRHNRYKYKRAPPMGSPTNAILGMFMLWWGWLGFNCGSTFGISGVKWKLAARSAVSTICASTAGGMTGLLLSYVFKKRQFDITFMINGVLGSLVAITATCAIAHPWEGLIIGMIGSFIAILSITLLDRLKIDDPVGCVGVHAMGGVWSLLAGGLFTRTDNFAQELQLTFARNGLFSGGGFHQLGVQTLAIVSIGAWTLVTSYIFLKLVNFITGLRIPLEEEYLGADIVEHGIGNAFYDKKTKKLVMFETDDDDDRFKELDQDAHAYANRARRRSHAFGGHPRERFAYLGSQQNLVRRSNKKKPFFDFRFRNRFKRKAKTKTNSIKSSLHYSDNDSDAAVPQRNGDVYRIRGSDVPPSEVNFVFANSPITMPMDLRARRWSGCDNGDICTVHCENEYHSSETSENTHM
ncbi:putative ammonium transporter 2 [Gigantopelta aegis]|uniref:putative ammonium transporter 2 n=1 Tax=Gigantopelta aegis TaxID=1735272 RepID=UPI001B88C43F|nr:putative ammonium transporter 2 [Gigantopelta aegis]